jgi:small-conductance mechanosensitive channel
MNEFEIKVLETLVVLVFYAISFFITKTVINNALKNTQLQRTRRKIIVKVVQLFISITVLVLISAVWGLEQSKIALFASTIITAIGIAFFAQWSLLSNVTSSILLFFNHPVKLGDQIRVMDKDSPFEGEVIELTYFFVHLKTKHGEVITVPNSILIVKPILIVSDKK